MRDSNNKGEHGGAGGREERKLEGERGDKKCMVGKEGVNKGKRKREERKRKR